MQGLTHTEENYLKAIYKIFEKDEKVAGTNAIAAKMKTTPASVTDMIKRLSGKGLVNYEKYKGVTLTGNGNDLATNLIRRHRLWEVFLLEKLKFSWDEVHEIAHQLEHIDSVELTDRLDDFLGKPRFDPHGDPIPDAEGNYFHREQVLVYKMREKQRGVIVGVKDHSVSFLKFLEKTNLILGTKIKIVEKYEFDNSIKVLLNEKDEIIIPGKVAENLFIQISG